MDTCLNKRDESSIDRTFLNAREFEKCLEKKTRKERSLIYSQHERNLLSLIATTKDFYLILKYLDFVQRKSFYSLAKEQVLNTVCNITDLVWIASFMASPERLDIFTTLGFNTVLSWVQQDRDMDAVLRYLPKDLELEFQSAIMSYSQDLDKHSLFLKSYVQKEKEKTSEASLWRKELSFKKNTSIPPNLVYPSRRFSTGHP